VTRQQKLIVDGYNVIYTDDRLRRTAIKDRQRAREQLIGLLGDYLSNRDIQATVVFDGRGGIVDAESIVPGKLQVMFSARNQTADDLILSTIRESGNARAYIVVTSDMAHIGRPAREMGCEVIGSKRFLARLISGEHQGRDRHRSQCADDYGDTDYWLERFGEENGEES
jgi:predicted RNA-binding protein with PIN domain